MNCKLLIVLALVSCLVISKLIAPNPNITHIFTADLAPVVYHDTVFLYTGHDTASHRGEQSSHTASFKYLKYTGTDQTYRQLNCFIKPGI